MVRIQASGSEITVLPSMNTNLPLPNSVLNRNVSGSGCTAAFTAPDWVLVVSLPDLMNSNYLFENQRPQEEIQGSGPWLFKFRVTVITSLMRIVRSGGGKASFRVLTAAVPASSSPQRRMSVACRWRAPAWQILG